MRSIDETFLKPHAATETWWSQSSTCALCRHHDDTGPGGRRCLQAPIEVAMHAARFSGAFCIDARLEAGPCGPEAKLFQPL